jgi:3-oxoadipate enol-lactonase
MIDAVSFGGMEAVIPIALRRIYTEAYLREHPDMGEARAAVLRRTDVVGFVTACTALQRLDYRDQATRVANRTMILVGEDDQATPPDLAEELHSLIEGSTLRRMPGLAHAPQLQDPNRFVDATREILGP